MIYETAEAGKGRELDVRFGDVCCVYSVVMVPYPAANPSNFPCWPCRPRFEMHLAPRTFYECIHDQIAQKFALSLFPACLYSYSLKKMAAIDRNQNLDEKTSLFDRLFGFSHHIHLTRCQLSPSTWLFLD